MDTSAAANDPSWPWMRLMRLMRHPNLASLGVCIPLGGALVSDFPRSSPFFLACERERVRVRVRERERVRVREREKKVRERPQRVCALAGL